MIFKLKHLHLNLTWLAVGTIAMLSLISVGVIAHEKKAQIEPSETVVLLHGLGRSESSMWLLARRLKKAGYHVERIGYESLKQTPKEILLEADEKIKACCTAPNNKLNNSSNNKIHFVGHSLGGIVIRAWLAENSVANMGRVVLIGTPNHGTPIVDELKQYKFSEKFIGPTGAQLNTSADSFIQKLPKPDYELGVIAGISVMTRLTPDKIEMGEHDGLVPVESTKVDGMTDFITLKTSHGYMRYDKEVSKQVLSFLQSGRFDQEA